MFVFSLIICFNLENKQFKEVYYEKNYDNYHIAGIY